MNDQECDQVYDTLLTTLTKSGLDWVSAQVIHQVHLGKTVEKEIDTLREAGPIEGLFSQDQSLSHFRKGPRAKFPVTEEYDPKERLLLLIDAIKQAIINTAHMESTFTEFFDSEIGHEVTVEFDSDQSGSPRAVVSHDGASSRLDSAQNLNVLLEKLQEEI